MRGFSIILIFKGIMALKSNSHCVLLKKDINFNKIETESKK